VVENTDTVHNVLVCTLCSCYPLSILGLAPPWYKDRRYRARVVKVLNRKERERERERREKREREKERKKEIFTQL